MENDDESMKMRKKLFHLLSPFHSKIRTYIGVLAVRNAFIIQAGGQLRARPTTTWFTERLCELDITHNYFNVRRNLKILAGHGVLSETVVYQRVADQQKDFRVARQNEYHLKPEYLELAREAILKTCKAQSLGELFDPKPLPIPTIQEKGYP